MTRSTREENRSFKRAFSGIYPVGARPEKEAVELASETHNVPEVKARDVLGDMKTGRNYYTERRLLPDKYFVLEEMDNHYVMKALVENPL